jgi:dihydroorotate dehydrogenase
MKAVLFRMDPERAHALALAAARTGGAPLGRLLGGRAPEGPPRTVAGLAFKNPLGLAAGFDKNGVALPFWRALGFGHVEFGTVTPRPQPGNERPRLWRFPEAEALGNRLGFPGDGVAAVAARLARDKKAGDVVGINLGKNRDTPLEHAADDYVAALDATREVADYWTVNVSSPNTEGLRELQRKGPLTELLSKVRGGAGAVPVFVKLSPDLDDAGLDDAVAAAEAAGCAGLVATNTTLARPPGIEFDGGLSGRPLAARSREVLARLRARTRLPIVSVGGIDGPEEARARLAAGADLIRSTARSSSVARASRRRSSGVFPETAPAGALGCGAGRFERES